MQNFYPPLEPYITHRLQVDELHELYVEESGTPDGIPIVFLHGGPGAGCGEIHRRFFNPDVYRIILFDQRGCGRSTPHAELENNTTWDLVADMELIRRQLEINKWVLFGGSWGSTLALAYAETHPDVVHALVLRGIFLARKQDIQWFYQYGTSQIFPDYWQDYIQPIAENERDDMVTAYYKRLTSDDDNIRDSAARAWSIWEGLTASLTPDEQIMEHFGNPHAARAIARIECHYFINDSFLQVDQLLKNAHRLKNIPGYIVQGRYDMICPVDQAWALHKVWPQAELNIMPQSGHAVMETEIANRLIEITDQIAEQLK